MTNQANNQFSFKDFFVDILRNGQKVNEPVNNPNQQNAQATVPQDNQQPMAQAFGIAPNSAYNPMNGQSQVKSGGEKFAGILGALLKGGQ